MTLRRAWNVHAIGAEGVLVQWRDAMMANFGGVGVVDVGEGTGAAAERISGCVLSFSLKHLCIAWQ